MAFGTFDTLARIANEFSDFLKGCGSGLMADWELCLHSERDLFPDSGLNWYF